MWWWVKNMSRWARFLREHVSALNLIISEGKHFRNHTVTLILTNSNRPAKESRWSLSYLSAGFVKRCDVQCFVRTAGVHHLHRCCSLLWQQQLSALNTDIWPVSSADLDSDVVREHHGFLHSFKNVKSFSSVKSALALGPLLAKCLSKIVLLCHLRQTLWK